MRSLFPKLPSIQLYNKFDFFKISSRSYCHFASGNIFLSKMKFNSLCFLFLVSIHFSASAQQALSLNQALETAMNNYPSIKAKTNYLKSSIAYTKAAKREALPNIIVSGQQDYGTINGQN